MPAYPTNGYPANITITPFSDEALGGYWSGVGVKQDSGASAQWGQAADSAYFCPFVVSVPLIAVKMFCLNGATAAGNIDMGIYTAAGARLVSKGATAQSGTTTTQTLDITDTLLGPGQYYMAFGSSASTTTLYTYAQTALINTAGGCASMASAGTLPTTATFAACTTAKVPYFGLTMRTVI